MAGFHAFLLTPVSAAVRGGILMVSLPGESDVPMCGVFAVLPVLSGAVWMTPVSARTAPWTWTIHVLRSETFVSNESIIDRMSSTETGRMRLASPIKDSSACR